MVPVATAATTLVWRNSSRAAGLLMWISISGRRALGAGVAEGVRVVRESSRVEDDGGLACRRPRAASRPAPPRRRSAGPRPQARARRRSSRSPRRDPRTSSRRTHPAPATRAGRGWVRSVRARAAHQLSHSPTLVPGFAVHPERTSGVRREAPRSRAVGGTACRRADAAGDRQPVAAGRGSAAWRSGAPRQLGGQVAAQRIRERAWSAAMNCCSWVASAGVLEDQAVVGEHVRVVVQTGDRIAPLQPARKSRRTAASANPVGAWRLGRSADGRVGDALDDAGGLVGVVGEAVEDQVLLGGEVLEQGRFGDVRGRGDVRDRDLVEAALQEQRRSPPGRARRGSAASCGLAVRSRRRR